MEYAFFSQEDGSRQTGSRGTIEVFKLEESLASDGTRLRQINWPPDPGSLSRRYLPHFRPTSRLLYVTSETASNGTTMQGTLSVDLHPDSKKTRPQYRARVCVSQVSTSHGPKS